MITALKIIVSRLLVRQTAGGPGQPDALRTSTYTRAYDTRPAFRTLVFDGDRLTPTRVGPEAGKWLQQATLAIRARVPVSVLIDIIQPFPTFSEAILHGLRDLDTQITRPQLAAASMV